MQGELGSSRETRGKDEKKDRMKKKDRDKQLSRLYPCSPSRKDGERKIERLRKRDRTETKTRQATLHVLSLLTKLGQAGRGGLVRMQDKIAGRQEDRQNRQIETASSGSEEK